MKIRSKAPLRLGLAGGGTDVSPYSDTYGGSVLNATINLYAYSYIDTDNVDPNVVIFEAKDLDQREVVHLDEDIDFSDGLVLHKAVYKKVMDLFNNGNRIPLRVMTHSDAPPGSGLGSSSTMVVSMLEGYRNLLALPLGEYDIAHLAYCIEREDCSLSGGKQDQYAATFGGFNFMEFYADDRVVVNPLRVRRYIINELESSLILFFTGVSRDSARIIEDQKNSLSADRNHQLYAMHDVKKSAYRIKEHLFKADMNGIAEEFRKAWTSKKATSSSITTDYIDQIEQHLMLAGAKALKVSGAGGGGFMMIITAPENKVDVIKSLSAFDGYIHKFQFTEEGVYSWSI